jgi:hypothetical protein
LMKRRSLPESRASSTLRTVSSASPRWRSTWNLPKRMLPSELRRLRRHAPPHRARPTTHRARRPSARSRHGAPARCLYGRNYRRIRVSSPTSLQGRLPCDGYKSSNSAFASTRSCVSKPSVNQL